jgi:hypothetical protein
MSGSLLKSQAASPPPDMSPFFLRQYVKVSVNINVFLDVFQLAYQRYLFSSHLSVSTNGSLQCLIQL